jgi:hypothetical protein
LLARLDRLTPTREIAQIGAALQIAIAQLIEAGLVSRRGIPPERLTSSSTH